MRIVPPKPHDPVATVSPPRPSQARASAPSTAITLRAVLLAVILIPLNAWWLIETEYVRYADNGTTSALFFNAVSLVLILLLLNALLSRVRPAWRFSPGELVVVYVVVSVATNLQSGFIASAAKKTSSLSEV